MSPCTRPHDSFSFLPPPLFSPCHLFPLSYPSTPYCNHGCMNRYHTSTNTQHTFTIHTHDTECTTCKPHNTHANTSVSILLVSSPWLSCSQRHVQASIGARQDQVPLGSGGQLRHQYWILYYCCRVRVGSAHPLPGAQDSVAVMITRIIHFGGNQLCRAVVDLLIAKCFYAAHDTIPD